MRILNFPGFHVGATVESLWSSVLDFANDLEGLLFTTIHNKTIGTTETAVAHGKRWIPSIGIPVARTNVAVWQSRQPDERFCYFTAASSVVVDVKVYP